MATSPETVEGVLAALRSRRFSAKAMFGEYALYADGKVVALVCDDRLFVKVHPTTQALAGECELAPPYPGARDHYLLDEGQWMARSDLPQMLVELAGQLPAPKPKGKAARGKALRGKAAKGKGAKRKAAKAKAAKAKAATPRAGKAKR